MLFEIAGNWRESFPEFGGRIFGTDVIVGYCPLMRVDDDRVWIFGLLCWMDWIEKMCELMSSMWQNYFRGNFLVNAFLMKDVCLVMNGRIISCEDDIEYCLLMWVRGGGIWFFYLLYRLEDGLDQKMCEYRWYWKKILVSFSDEIFLFSSEWWIIAYKDYDFQYFALMRVDNDRVRIFDLLYQMKYGYENFRWMSLMLKNNMKDNPFQLKVFVQ